MAISYDSLLGTMNLIYKEYLSNNNEYNPGYKMKIANRVMEEAGKYLPGFKAVSNQIQFNGEYFYMQYELSYGVEFYETEEDAPESY